MLKALAAVAPDVWHCDYELVVRVFRVGAPAMCQAVAATMLHRTHWSIDASFAWMKLINMDTRSIEVGHTHTTDAFSVDIDDEYGRSVDSVLDYFV